MASLYPRKLKALLPARRLAILTGILFALSFNILLAAWLNNLYHSMQDRGWATAEGLLSANRIHTQQVLGEIDRAVREIGNLPVNLSPKELERLMFYKRSQLPVILNFFRLDSKGEILAWTGGEWKPEVSDRPYFTKHRDDADLGRLIEGPMNSRLTPGKWFISLSLGIRSKTGDFEGSVLATIDLEALSNEFRAIQDTPGASAVLTTLKGQVLVRQPPIDGSVGSKLPSFEGHDSGFPELSRWNAISPLDRMERMVTFQNVPGYPLAAGVTLLRENVMRGWGVYLVLAAFLTLAVTSATLMATWRIAGTIDRREHAIRHLRDSRASITAQLQYQQTLLNAIPIPLSTSDQGGLIVQCNNAFLRWVGLSVTEILGRNAASLLPPEIAQKYDHSFDELLEAGGQIQFETDWPDLHGHERRAIIYRTAHHGVDGRGSAIINIIVDVSAQKRIEDELKRSNGELEQFSYAISHDLQEPLRMVSSYLALVERRYKDKLDKDGLEFIDFAVDGAKRMSGMIQGLLEYSRVNRKGQSFRPVDLGLAAKDALVNLALAVSESQASVDIQALPEVNGDPGQLMRLMQNLIGNALKYRHPERKPQIAVSAERKDDLWVVTVADNGIGIAAPDTERLFKVFQRLHSRAQFEGYGIGLAVCRRIVERHGGRIWVTSEPDVGSRFCFSLPASPLASENA